MQAFVDGERGAFGFACTVVEGMHRQYLHPRRDAHELAVRGDGAGDRGAVRMRRIAAGKRVKAFYNGAVEVAMLGVDFGIDHGNRDGFSGRDLMRLLDLQLGQNILGGIARRGWSG